MMQKRKFTRIYDQLRQGGDEGGTAEFKRFPVAILCFSLVVFISLGVQPRSFANSPAFSVMPGNPGAKTQIVTSDVVGASLEIPAGWLVEQDPFLFGTFGFVLFDPEGEKIGGHARSPVMRVALAPQVKPGQIAGKIKDLMEKYKEFNLVRAEISVGGLKGIALSGMPGTDPFSLVYIADGKRVYRIGLWTAEPGLDERAKDLLARLNFQKPTRSIASLKLVPAEKAMRAQPSAEQMAINNRAHAERAALIAGEAREDALAENAAAPFQMKTINFARQTGVVAGCSEQPTSLMWQTPWDASNRFYTNYTTTYSGTYYNLRPNDPGWSAMSGNYGSWWGENFHVRCNNAGMLNQFYANDYPAHKNANVYSLILGTVEWAGWDIDDSENYYTLGNYVVVRNGSYRALMAHMTSLNVSPGASVGVNTVIGYAGRTGGYWDEHVHARVGYGESRTYEGQPYGGHSVKPKRIRCFSCRATDPGAADGYGDGQFDLKLSDGTKYYTRFYHGRWMRN
ncbi:MAG: hypothetical protein AVDCRST_MAG74-3393 [uncultured Pyrinomonadaceae bacterium]|uniref:M23ase beta-sheet core domain-containing protein n=1 Tax=uncultured Pyrinomonadaceae bacterium TaxID=2283094 RepID=A0A6J4PWY1_9BACT|nr:MAG: hypothetical protein AVDCRST_MAG74-3393 [uncultured Pyrinomonadaceae bacterium]